MNQSVVSIATYRAIASICCRDILIPEVVLGSRADARSMKASSVSDCFEPVKNAPVDTKANAHELEWLLIDCPNKLVPPSPFYSIAKGVR